MDHQEFVNNVHRLMKLKGWDQKDLANALGVSKMSVTNWLKGGHDPGQPTRLLIVRWIEDAENEVQADIVASKKARKNMSLVERA